MRLYVAILTFGTAALCFAGQPDDLKLPDGFHATVVAEGLGPIRHLTVRDNGDIYVSTPKDKDGKGGGIIALRLDSDHKAGQIEHFGSVDGGSGIRFSNGALYAAAPDGVYRFTFDGKALVPSKAPETIVEGTPADHPGFNRANRPITLDGKGTCILRWRARPTRATIRLLRRTRLRLGSSRVRIWVSEPGYGGSARRRRARSFPAMANSWQQVFAI